MEVLDRDADVPDVGRLDGPAEDLVGFVHVPDLDLEDELLERASLHFGFGILEDSCLVVILGHHSEDDSFSDSTGSASSLKRG